MSLQSADGDRERELRGGFQMLMSSRHHLPGLLTCSLNAEKRA